MFVGKRLTRSGAWRLLASRRLTLPAFCGSIAARAKAAGVHALASALVVVGLTALLLGQLYPKPYFDAAGGAKLLILMAVVDVVAGPLLTFCVFNCRKSVRELRRDMAVIVLLQAAALGFGLYSTALGRPVFQTFVVDRFELLSAAEVDEDQLASAPQTLRALSWSGPRLAGALRPVDPAEREQLLLASTMGIDLRHLLSRYVPYDRVRSDVIAASKPLDTLLRYNDPAAVARVLAHVRRDALTGEVRWLPLQGKHADLTVLVDSASGEPLATVALKPW